MSHQPRRGLPPPLTVAGLSLADPPPLHQNAKSPRPRTPLGRPTDEQTRRRIEEQCGHLRLCPDNAVPAFELIVLGCGGGPIETNLSSYLVKPYHAKWTDGCTGLEGGSTIGALSSLIERNPCAFEGFGLEIGVDEHELDKDGGGLLDGVFATVGVGREGGGKAAAKVWDLISCFAITHAHLDHIAGLIISSAACRPPPKPVWGIKRTIENIERAMDGGLWPMLGCWDNSMTLGKAYHYKHVPAPTTTPLPLSPSLSFHAFPLSHGTDPSVFRRKAGPNPDKPCSECYDSTAFFVRDESGSGKELLFFGDVEPDSISKRGLNLEVWKVAAPKIAAGKLNVIFLECSYPSSQPANQLYGHLSPPYILEEMVVLADLVRQERRKAGLDERLAAQEPLKDVIIVIQHIKDDIFALPKPFSPSASRSNTLPSANASTAGSREKDLPPPPPPKDTPSTPSSPTTPTTSSPAKRTFRPPCRSETIATSSAPSAASSNSAESAQLLTMSPPVPSVPHRRPSAAYAFPASPLATAVARNSIHRQSTALGSDGHAFPPASGAPAAWNAALDARRQSAPWIFGLQSNPFAAGSAGRLASALPPGQPIAGGHSAPPSSARGLAPPAKIEFAGDAGGGGGKGTFSFNGGTGGSSPGRSPGRSPTSTSAYSAPGVAPLPEESEEPDGTREPETAEEEDEEMVDETVHERIERELFELEAKEKTGVRFLIAQQGMRLVF
ncbi:hypothetical protein JCM10213_008959 [Rhodosporidiobolus nylandii]